MVFNITRISDEERQKIPKEHRCEISYNGYHVWEVIRTEGTKTFVVCKKCLEKRYLTEEVN